VFNLDGSEADACGNGLRCVVRYALGKKLIERTKPNILVETMSGVRQVRLGKGIKPSIQVTMGKPIFTAEDIPVAVKQNDNDVKLILDYPLIVDGKKLKLNCVSMGNPHAIYFIDTPVEDYELLQAGPKVEKNKLFPKAVNFEIARIINRNLIEARVWERGVGETLACGSGACAIAVTARLHGFIDNPVDIKLPGGILNIEWDGSGEVFLSGPSEIVFTGEWMD
jgi:diaminopimelate epimerase